MISDFSAVFAAVYQLIVDPWQASYSMPIMIVLLVLSVPALFMLLIDIVHEVWSFRHEANPLFSKIGAVGAILFLIALLVRYIAYYVVG